MAEKSKGGLLWKLALGAGAALAARELIRRARRVEFQGKVVLITGGSRGLGLCLARQFAEEGASLALCARDEAELARAREELAAEGADVFTTVCDVGDQASVEAMMQAVWRRFGRLDVLINNAGVIEVAPVDAMEVSDYEEAMRTHFWGPLYTSLAALPLLRQQTGARIVNVASIGGKIGVPHLVPYCASKFALVGLSEGLRSELAREGITVTTVCPGLVRTGSHLRAKFKGQHRKEYTVFTLFQAIPGNSVSADRAARRIIEACRYGEAEIVIGVPFQAAALAHGLFPGVTQDLFGLANRALPTSGGRKGRPVEGKDSQTKASPSWFTAPLEKAATENNELPAGETTQMAQAGQAHS